MSPKKAFGILAGIFGCAVVFGAIAGIVNRPPSASASQTPSPAVSDQIDPRAREHRMWLAKQMADRLNEKVATARRMCDLQMTGVSQAKCRAADRVGPTLTLIADLASGSTSNVVLWTMAIDAVHELEADLTR